MTRKVLLVGWDAADWVILQPLIDAGVMPVTAKLIKHGVSGAISTLHPILSPMLWNSIATGKRPDLHGIYGFVEPRPDGSGVRPATSTSRTCKAIWNILSQSDIRSNIINWFASFPAETIEGTVVTDRYTTQVTMPAGRRRVGPAMVHPARLAGPLAELIVDPAQLDAQTILPFVPKGKLVDQSKDDRIQKLARLIAKMSTVHAAACKTMVEEQWDFMAVYYDAIDHFGHTFMPYHPPAMEGVDPQDAEIYGNCVTACYQFQDMMLGAMLQYAGQDTTVILVSDHGFHSEEKRPHIDGYKDPVSWHRQHGVVVAAGPGIRQAETFSGASLLDVTPTILSMFDLPIGRDMDGRPWVEIFETPPQIERIDSWESVDGQDGMHPEDLREDPVAAAEAIKQLVDLGYVEAPDEDIEKQVAKTVRSMKYNQAMALTYSRRRADAIPLWKELIDQCANKQDIVPLKLQLGTCLLRLGQFADAEKLLYSFGPGGLKRPDVQMMMATLRLHQDRGQEALQHLESASPMVSENNPQFTAQLGLAYLQTYQLDKAIEYFQMALEYDSENAIAHYGMADLANRRGQYRLAVEHALNAIELADAVPAGHFQLGFALAKLGMLDEAIMALETVIQLSPDLAKARVLLEELYKQQSLRLDSEQSDLAAGSANSVEQRLQRYLDGEKSSVFEKVDVVSGQE